MSLMLTSARRAAAVLLAAAFLLPCLNGCAAGLGAAAAGDTALPFGQEYVVKLFGSGVITLEITADEQSWARMLENAEVEEYLPCDVRINGTTFRSVGIRPKGNSSLRQVASSDSDRYSFRLKFDKYVKGQTCFGLTDFVLNNMIGDASYMKEYLSYDIMRFIGVNTPLVQFADISVNGAAWGFYLAVEKYDDAFESRVYGDTSGQLYNVKMPDSQGAQPAADQAGLANMPATAATMQGVPQGMPPGGQSAGGMGRGMGAASSGGALVYTNDDPASYAAIFDSAVSSQINTADKQAVVAAIKALNTGEGWEVRFDVDQLLRYFAAHTVVVNLDSYVSSMAQNYYLYEKNGVLSVLPWDYNLAFGGFQGGGASETVNFPIDTPVSGVSMQERPLLARLLENETYKARYHAYLQQIADGYLSDIADTIAALDERIKAYVQADASSFVTYEQYTAAAPMLRQLLQLRAQSIKGQLDGSIPATAQGQSAEPGKLVNASSIDMQALGRMAGGMGGDGFPGGGGGFRPGGGQGGFVPPIPPPQ